MHAYLQLNFKNNYNILFFFFFCRRLLLKEPFNKTSLAAKVDTYLHSSNWFVTSRVAVMQVDIIIISFIENCQNATYTHIGKTCTPFLPLVTYRNVFQQLVQPISSA